MSNPIRSKLADGDIPIGTMVLEFSTTGVARLAASAGADWILFDMEHTGWSTADLRTALATTRGAAITPIVRPQSLSYHHCSVLLDVGAKGVMAPMVETPEQAELLVASCRYPPRGRRGAAFGVAHDDYLPGDPSTKMTKANDEILTIAMIETPTGVDNADDIVAVDGLDALWIGHFDLTSFMGIPGEFGHPAFIDAVSRVLTSAARVGKPVGILVNTVDEAKTRIDQGFRWLLYGTDIVLYRQALSTGITGVRAFIESAHR